jgi:hypothetical protein
MHAPSVSTEVRVQFGTNSTATIALRMRASGWTDASTYFANLLVARLGIPFNKNHCTTRVYILPRDARPSSHFKFLAAPTWERPMQQSATSSRNFVIARSSAGVTFSLRRSASFQMLPNSTRLPADSSLPVVIIRSTSLKQQDRLGTVASLHRSMCRPLAEFRGTTASHGPARPTIRDRGK